MSSAGRGCSQPGLCGEQHPEKKALNNERREERGIECLEALEAGVP